MFGYADFDDEGKHDNYDEEQALALKAHNEKIKDLILYPDKEKFPDYDTFATFSYIFKFLSEPEPKPEPEPEPEPKPEQKPPPQVIYPLLKIKEDDTTYKNLNQKYGGENENRTFKEKLIRTYNSYGVWYNVDDFFYNDADFFYFNDESTNKELTAEADENIDLRIGCNPSLKNDKTKKDKINTFNTLFKKDVKTSDFIEIDPDIVDAVKNLFNTQAWDIKLVDVPIYFVLKTNGENNVKSHVSSYIYFKNKFYSFGVGGGWMGSAYIFPIDTILFFNSNNLDAYRNIIHTINDNISEFEKMNIAKKKLDLNITKMKEQLDRDITEKEQLDRDITEKEQLDRNITEKENDIYYMEKGLRTMPFVGLKIIDMGVLTQFHIDNINDIIKNIEKINVDLCITKNEETEKLKCIVLNMPKIKLINSYAVVKSNLIGSIKNNRDVNSKMLNNRINCVYSMDYIFGDTLKCDKKGVIAPGFCRKIMIDDETGGYKENPLKYENIKLMFDLLYKAKKGEYTEYVVGTPEPIRYITFAEISQASYTTINRSFFKNRQKCVNMVDDINLKKFIGQILPSNGRDWTQNNAFKGGWIEARTETGDVYYYNIMTGESTWELPKDATPIPNIQNIDLPNNISKEQCTNIFKDLYDKYSLGRKKEIIRPQSGIERFGNFFYNLMPSIPNIGFGDDFEEELSFGRLGGGKTKRNKTRKRSNKSRKLKLL